MGLMKFILTFTSVKPYRTRYVTDNGEETVLQISREIVQFQNA